MSNMIKASSRIIVLLFWILLLCAQDSSGGPRTRNRNKPKLETPAPKGPTISQLEEQLQSTQTTVEGVLLQIQNLNEVINRLSDRETTRDATMAETAVRLKSNWYILSGTTVLAVLVGGICGVFLPLRQRRLHSSQRQQLIELSNKTEALKKETENLNDRLELLEGRMQDISESLLTRRDTETVQADGDTTSPTQCDDSPTTAKADQPVPSVATDSDNGSIASIGIVPPSEYVAAIQSATVVCKTTTTNQDFRYPGKLIESEGGRFLILSVKDGTNLHNLALPTSDRLLGSDEFTYYYKSIFDCEQPVSGEIYVIAPAKMDEDTQQGGWMLHSRGKLQIRR